MRQYLAYYEDAVKVEVAAKAAGFTGNDGESWYDVVEAGNYEFRTVKMFKELMTAEAWLRGEIAAVKSVYGCGTIIEQQPVAQRCRYCTCRGVEHLREYTVDDEGIVDDYALESMCLNEHDGGAL
jgi:hypothetical protein